MDNLPLITIVIACLWGMGMIGYKVGYRKGHEDENESWNKWVDEGEQDER